MKMSTYLTIHAIAGPWGAPPLPKRLEIDHGCGVTAGCAIYVAFDGEGGCQYVGSVASVRDQERLNARINEHMRKRYRANAWAFLHVFPLRADTPELEVRAIEGRIGRVLRPRGNRRLPATG